MPRLIEQGTFRYLETDELLLDKYSLLLFEGIREVKWVLRVAIKADGIFCNDTITILELTK